MHRSNRNTLTIDQIKKNAKSLKKANPKLLHSEALDQAAKEQGFGSYHEAHKVLAGSRKQNFPHPYLQYLAIQEVSTIIKMAESFQLQRADDISPSKPWDSVQIARQWEQRRPLEDYITAFTVEKRIELAALMWYGRNYDVEDASAWHSVLEDAHRRLDIYNAPRYIIARRSLATYLRNGLRKLSS